MNFLEKKLQALFILNFIFSFNINSEIIDETAQYLAGTSPTPTQKIDFTPTKKIIAEEEPSKKIIQKPQNKIEGDAANPEKAPMTEAELIKALNKALDRQRSLENELGEIKEDPAVKRFRDTALSERGFALVMAPSIGAFLLLVGGAAWFTYSYFAKNNDEKAKKEMEKISKIIDTIQEDLANKDGSDLLKTNSNTAKLLKDEEFLNKVKDAFESLRAGNYGTDPRTKFDLVNYFSDRLQSAINELPDEITIKSELKEKMNELDVVSKKTLRQAVSSNRKQTASAANIIQGFGFNVPTNRTEHNNNSRTVRTIRSSPNIVEAETLRSRTNSLSRSSSQIQDDEEVYVRSFSSSSNKSSKSNQYQTSPRRRSL